MTDIDELLDYSYRARSLILADKTIMALMSDDPDYDPDSAEAEEYEERVKDHDYVDETSLTANSYIVIETEMSNLDTPEMKTMFLYVNVICNKKYMDLNPRKFKGYKGNRRDNIARLVNNLLNNNSEFGVGDLHLMNATVGSVPTGFTSRVLVYKVPSFARYGAAL